MTNKELDDSREPADGKARAAPESRPGWKSKWVESGAITGASDPARDGHGAPGERPDDVKYDGPSRNPPEIDELPGDGGEESANG
jgi:hypothetical protein